MAHDIGCQPSQLALAWLIQRGVVPIPSTTKIRTLNDHKLMVNYLMFLDGIKFPVSFITGNMRVIAGILFH